MVRGHLRSTYVFSTLVAYGVLSGPGGLASALNSNEPDGIDGLEGCPGPASVHQEL